MHVINIKQVQVDFDGWILTLSSIEPSENKIRIDSGTISFFLAQKVCDIRFSCMLTLTKKMAEKTSTSPKGWKNPIWGAIYDLYPFAANKIEIPVRVKSPSNEINLTVNVVLPSHIISYAIGDARKGFESTHSLEEDKYWLFSGHKSAKDDVSKTFEMTLRYKPFISFRKAVTPTVIIYAAALIMQIISGLSSVSFQWQIFGVTMESSIPFKLLQFITNVFFFTRISKISVGMNTRCLLQFLRILAWFFIGLLTVHVAYPEILLVIYSTFGLNIFDLVLKFSQIWIIASVAVSLLIYPYIENAEKRANYTSFILVVLLIISIVWWVLLPPLGIAEDILKKLST